MPIKCADCERSFADENALYQHRKVKHRGKPNPRPEREGEESIADLVIEANLARMCGEDHPDMEWLRDSGLIE